MFKKHKVFNFFYVLIVILNVYALVSNNQLLRMIAMPLIGMSLMLYLLIKTKVADKFHQLIFVGLVLLLAGDIQLLFTTGVEFYFITALVATLLGYTFYSIAYFIDFKRDARKSKRIGNLFLIISIITIASFFWSANRNIGDFMYPAIAYFAVLSVMTVLSGYRYKRVNRLSFKLVFTGSFAFVISDLSIGYYNFIDDRKIMMISFLLTYMVAQYLVVMGSIERKPI